MNDCLLSSVAELLLRVFIILPKGYRVVIYQMGDEHSAEVVRISETVNVARPRQGECAIERVHCAFFSYRKTGILQRLTHRRLMSWKTIAQNCVAWLFNNINFADTDTERRIRIS
jgi:hypothetical protein